MLQPPTQAAWPCSVPIPAPFPRTPTLKKQQKTMHRGSELLPTRERRMWGSPSWAWGVPEHQALPSNCNQDTGGGVYFSDEAQGPAQATESCPGLGLDHRESAVLSRLPADHHPPLGTLGRPLLILGSRLWTSTAVPASCGDRATHPASLLLLKSSMA